MHQQQTTFKSLEEVMSKFQLSAIVWSTLTCCAVLVSSLTNAASAQQAGFEGLPSYPGFAQTGTSNAGAAQASPAPQVGAPQVAAPQVAAPQVGAPQVAAPQVTMSQAQPAFSEQQLINSMTNSVAPAAQNPAATQAGAQPPATMQSPASALSTASDESLANATASMEDAHAAAMESTLTELEAAHAHAYNTLAAVLEKVPADARPALQQAMEQSRQGYQKARDNRERVVAHKMNSQNARRGRHSVAGNGTSGQYMQAGQHSQAGANGQPGLFAGQQPSGQLPNPQQALQNQQSQQNQQVQQNQQGYAGQRPNPIQARTASGPSQPNYGTAQFNTAQGASSGAPQGSMQGSTLGLIEGTTSGSSQANPSVAQPANRNYSTPEMNRAAPGRPLINGVNGTAQGNNFGVPANQRNPNFGTSQPNNAAQGSNRQNLSGQNVAGQNVTGQSVNGQGMPRPSTPDLNRYNQAKPSAGNNSQPGTATGAGTPPTGSNPGFGFSGSGTRQ
jgi:hypothetical protein